MSPDWADKTAQQLLGRGLLQTGACLILGAVDTGKTTLALALAKHLAASQPVGFVDADVGQSHIGPPTTVGWALIDNPQADFSKLTASGISFVGDVTPVRHLLQLTAAIVRGVQEISKLAELIIIDTPGFIQGQAATALWWTVYQIIKPALILAVQRSDELSDILAGLMFSPRPLRQAQGRLCGGGTSAPGAEANNPRAGARGLGRIEKIQCPLDIPVKSPPERRCYRQSQFSKYFRDFCYYDIDIKDVVIRTSWSLNRESLVNRLVGLRNQEGLDVAIGVITDVRQGGDIVVVKAPRLDVQQVRCLVVGDIAADVAGASGG